MATKRKLAKKQIELMKKIQKESGVNIVECGNCGTILLHEIDLNVDTVECFGCKEEMAKCDCPDYWYENCQNNAEFDED
jgi:hypothetical protein